MRVLSISTLFPPPNRPGFGIFVANQMRSVVARGDVDLTMISPQGIPPWPLSLKPPYASLRDIPSYSDAVGIPVNYPRFTLIPKVGGDTNPKRIAQAILPLVRTLHAEKPFDLVDAQFFFPDGPAAAMIANELQLPLSIKSRGADIHYWGSRPKALKQMLAAATRADRLLAVSQALKSDMIALGMAEARISVHYTGLDRQKFYPNNRASARRTMVENLRMALPSEATLLVTPGALIPRKGQRIVIEALQSLPNAHLALAGSGEDETSLRALARDLGLASRVHFLGQISHEVLPQLMSAADALVLPSASEGLANVWIESLACGTPIVVPDIGGAAEILKDPSAGRLAVRDPIAVANALSELLANPPSQDAVVKNVAQFSWDANARNLVEIWQGIL